MCVVCDSGRGVAHLLEASLEKLAPICKICYGDWCNHGRREEPLVTWRWKLVNNV